MEPIIPSPVHTALPHSHPAPPPETASRDPLTPEERATLTEQQWKTFAVINEWLRFADTKAGAILTANGVLAGVAIGVLKDHRTYLLDHLWITGVATFGLLAVLGSASYCLLCIFPKTRIGDPRSLIFFDHIARKFPKDPGAYAQAVLDAAADRNEPFKQISQQVWANSLVAEKKHRQVACAIRLLIVGLLCCLVLGIAALEMN